MGSDHFTLFQDAVRSDDRPHKVIVFADLSGSTEMKGKSAEVNWLPSIGRFLDIVTEATTGHGGTVVKYLGDGAMSAFDSDNAEDAICAAIRIQEMLDKESSTGRLRDCYATVGIATGPVVEYQAPGGGVDYVGSVVDLAARLCGAGAPQAIWVDSPTVVSANMSKVTSEKGRALGFSYEDYLSDEEKVELKGFTEAIRYKEVIWHLKPFGVKNAVLTEKINRSEQHREGANGFALAVSREEEAIEGTVVRWDPSLGRGFIATAASGDHYVDRRYVVGGGDLTEGRLVRFLPRQPMREGARPVAACTAQEGHTVHATFQRILSQKGYGFVDVLDSRGNRQVLYIYLGPQSATRRSGEAVTVEICRNHKGISARLPGEMLAEKADDDVVG